MILEEDKNTEVRVTKRAFMNDYALPHPVSNKGHHVHSSSVRS